MPNYFFVEEYPYCKGKFIIRMAQAFYDLLDPAPLSGGRMYSYGNIFHRLYGLKQSEFLKYVIVKFNGLIIQPGYVFCVWGFTNMNDANRFCVDINDRFRAFLTLKGIGV